jgi:hypothetical protein
MVATTSGWAADLAAKLPPTVRDFDIFRFVKVECRSTRAAAREFGLSQTRIRQIVAEVRDYFLACVPRGTSEDDEESDTRLVVAQQFAHEQLDFSSTLIADVLAAQMECAQALALAERYQAAVCYSVAQQVQFTKARQAAQSRKASIRDLDFREVHHFDVLEAFEVADRLVANRNVVNLHFH